MFASGKAKTKRCSLAPTQLLLRAKVAGSQGEASCVTPPTSSVLRESFCGLCYSFDHDATASHDTLSYVCGLLFFIFKDVFNYFCPFIWLCCIMQDLSLHFMDSSCGLRAPEREGWVVVVHGLSCSEACGILDQDRGSNLHPLHWKVDS